MILIMKTRSIAQAGLLCALYGVLLFFNAAGGLLIEGTMSFLFALPVLAVCLIAPLSAAACSFAAMLIETLLFSGITTWILALPMLVCGFAVGASLSKGWPLQISAAAGALLDALAVYVSMTLFARLFGFDGQAEREVFAHLTGLISWNGFLWILSLCLGVLEVIPVVCIAILMVLDKRHLFKGTRARLNLHISIAPWNAYVFAVSLIALICAKGNMIICPVEFQDFLWVICCMEGFVMLYEGARVLFKRISRRNPSRLKLFCFAAAVLIPGINLIPACVGWMHLIAAAFHNKG